MKANAHVHNVLEQWRQKKKSKGRIRTINFEADGWIEKIKGNFPVDHQKGSKAVISGTVKNQFGHLSVT